LARTSERLQSFWSGAVTCPRGLLVPAVWPLALISARAGPNRKPALECDDPNGFCPFPSERPYLAVGPATVLFFSTIAFLHCDLRTSRPIRARMFSILAAFGPPRLRVHVSQLLSCCHKLKDRIADVALTRVACGPGMASRSNRSASVIHEDVQSPIDSAENIHR